MMGRQYSQEEGGRRWRKKAGRHRKYALYWFY
jgi:hypothetical protein